MAVTSIWPIKNGVNHVLNYANNPEKVTAEFVIETAALHSIGNTIEYAANELKTEKRMYVKGINCNADDAARQFMQTKRLFKKTDGRAAFHGYQSFKEGEVTAEQAHKIGVELARKLWGDRFEVLVATHLNTGHYHNHFVINSVSFVDGLKFINRREDYIAMRDLSDELCRTYGLSVVKTNGRGKNYAEWNAERNGAPTIRGQIRADIDCAIQASTTEYGFIRTMQKMGYEMRIGGNRKYPSLKPHGAKGCFRFHKLGEGYSYDEIVDRVYQNRRKVPLKEREKVRHTERMHGSVKKTKKLTGFRARYFYYCYKLNIIRRRPLSGKPVHFMLREDLIKLDKINEETRFLGRTKIDTIEDLNAFRASARSETDRLISERTALGKLAGKGDENAKTKVSEINEELKKLRRDIAICDRIEERSARIQHVAEDTGKEKQNDEYIRRSGRSGRENDIGRR